MSSPRSSSSTAYAPSTSVLRGIRSSSTTCTVTRQPSSERSTPSTDSSGRPSSPGKSRRTAATASRADRRPFPFPERSAILPRLPPGKFGLARAGNREPLEQIALARLALLVVEQPVIGGDLELDHLRADAVLVVELALGLVCDLLGHPSRPAHGRERERQQTCEQAHQPAAPSSSTNEYGGSGPVAFSRIRPACSR